MSQICFITGTDTGVGKTVLTASLARYLHRRGVAVAALKPICSGGRSDARVLREALDGALSLDEINPWHFRAALAPSLAARLECKRVTLPEVLEYVRNIQRPPGNRVLPGVHNPSPAAPPNGRRGFDVILIEGAGGLLSPLGEGFDARSLISKLNATPVIVAPNRLGVVNHLWLTLEALPRRAVGKAAIVLMSQRQANAASRTNAQLLEEQIGPERVLVLPFLSNSAPLLVAMEKAHVRGVLESLVRRLDLEKLLAPNAAS